MKNIFFHAIVKMLTSFSGGLAIYLEMHHEDTPNFAVDVKIGKITPSYVLHCNFSHTFLALELRRMVQTSRMGRHVISHLRNVGQVAA
jgi:hypothetical protein